MKGKTVLIVLVAVLATAASVIVGTRAIMGTATDGRTVSASAETDAGEIEIKGTEVVVAVVDIEESSDEEAVARDDRDPMVKYRAPRRRESTTTPTPPEPAALQWPSYKVTMVVSGDDDPRAILSLGGESISVKVGDDITGGRVTAIESDGVTIEGEAGTRTYPF